MALCTRITRNGKPITIPWNWWHVQCMIECAEIQNPDNPRVLQEVGSFIVKSDLRFVMADVHENDIDAHTSLTLLAGDVLEMWRDR